VLYAAFIYDLLLTSTFQGGVCTCNLSYSQGQVRSLIRDMNGASVLYPVIGKASDWFEKGAVIGYRETEIQVGIYLPSILVSILNLT
jgi:hypothetical protein